MFNEVFNANTEGLYQVVKKEQISICGYGPTMASMEFSKKLGQKTLNSYSIQQVVTSLWIMHL